MIIKDKNTLSDLEASLELEWIETNGLGGWSSSTIIGTNTRRYHGLLVAATNPPVERKVMLSKLEEIIEVDGERFELGTNIYPNRTVHPNGFQYLQQFSKDIFPKWKYDAGSIQLEKEIVMIYGENTVVVNYKVIRAASPFTLRLLPLVAGRDYHSLLNNATLPDSRFTFSGNTLHGRPDAANDLYINVPGAQFAAHGEWFRNFQYPVEQYRGLDFQEDLFNPGTISITLNEGDQLAIVISTSNTNNKNGIELIEQERRRREALLNDHVADPALRQLVLAADQFIVKRDKNLNTVIAGYHWFTDWARDTMISLPGLCLSTGRYDEARNILRAFANSVDEGMLPNRFRDGSEPPEYNNVDGTLWFFIAVYKYMNASGDKEFVLNELLPVLKSIIDWHHRGTRFNIRVQDDGLLFAGERGQQLTWMDARIGDWVVTPRMGNPVEIQALWYNAQMIFAELLSLNGQSFDQYMVMLSAEKTRITFNERFWNEELGCLLDSIDENGIADSTLRANQLLAISLPFALMEGNQAQSIVSLVEKELYTPVGLRTLPVSHSQYIAKYGGDQWHRDSSYHQGTVWSWLLGPYVDALVKTNADREKIKSIVHHFSKHLEEGCIGSVSEIFDASPPHHPRGCCAQAWGVAEWLRVIKDYDLYNNS